jgi:uncharacterized protein (TIGR02145 family)
MKTTGNLESGTGLWYSPNTEATNSSGFSGAPGGYRLDFGEYGGVGLYGYWWSSSEGGTDVAWDRNLDYDNGFAFSYSYFKQVGFSVRCLRG